MTTQTLWGVSGYLLTTIMTRHFLAILLTHLVLTATSQKMTVITLDNSKIEVTIISDSAKHKLLQDFNGKQDNTIRKQWTARTYRLSDGRLLIEFYDRQAAIINNAIDFDKLKEIRFIKTYIDFLKKNISYKIELNYDKGKEIVKQFNLKKNDKFKSELLDFTSIEVYELTNGQILFINTTNNSKSAAIYENIKALASECNDVQNQFYGDLETSSEKFINGDPLLDYENDGQWVYPKDEKKVIQNHKLKLVESKVFVETFYGNLYKSDNGYYVLINEVNQKNGGGNKMGILTARVYESLEEVRKAQAKYEKFKNEGVKSEHFYQKISDKYGKDFPSFTKQLIDSLPLVLNFDKEQLTFDSIGMTIVDEAIHWNHSNYSLFDNWYPSVLAYYGQCYIVDKKVGSWIVKKDTEYDVFIPHLVLSNGEDAFDVRDFYKDLSEWAIPIKIAGDWDGRIKQMRSNFKTQNSR
jgi:hypothetical protein